jgi:ElaB/YqjD/DUF883 family membrane-anchored ribosome-binding protein
MAKKTVKKKPAATTKKEADLKMQAANLKKQAQAHLARAKKQFAAAEKSTKAYIRNNPKKAVAIAAGIGAAIGVVVARARKKK